MPPDAGLTGNWQSDAILALGAMDPEHPEEVVAMIWRLACLNPADRSAVLKPLGTEGWNGPAMT